MDEKGQQSEGVPPATVISYETAAGPTGTRPKWVYGVVGIYLLLLAAVWGFPVLWAANDSSADNLRVVSGFATLLTACGVGLIYIPVRVVRRRPISRRSIWFPIIAAGALVILLFIGAGMALTELFNPNGWPNWSPWAFIYSAVAVWLGWSVVFGLIALRRNPESVGMKLHRWLIAGSVLELLIAVPAHIIVRRRTECCAGIATGMAICIGVGIALVSFGPSVLLLFFLRRKQIRIEG